MSAPRLDSYMTMADGIDAGLLPLGLQAYAGYTDGHWPSFATVCRRFYPHAHCVSITVRGGNAQFCDCEQGDLSIRQAVDWLRARLVEPRLCESRWELEHTHNRHAGYRPGIYVSAANAQLVLSAMKVALPQAPRHAWRLWVAHWTATRPAGPPDGSDAVQWRSTPDYDLSICRPDFFAPQTWKPPVLPPPTEPY